MIKKANNIVFFYINRKYVCQSFIVMLLLIRKYVRFIQ